MNDGAFISDVCITVFPFFHSILPDFLMKALNVSPVLVMSLKRLLVGSISLSEDSQTDGENGEEPLERPSQEMDRCQSTGMLVCEVNK